MFNDVPFTATHEHAPAAHAYVWVCFCVYGEGGEGDLRGRHLANNHLIILWVEIKLPKVEATSSLMRGCRYCILDRI